MVGLVSRNMSLINMDGLQNINKQKLHTGHFYTPMKQRG